MKSHILNLLVTEIITAIEKLHFIFPNFTSYLKIFYLSPFLIGVYGNNTNVFSFTL